MACLKEKRKPMMPVRILDIISRRRYLANTQYYYTNRDHAFKDDKDNVATGVAPRRPFGVPRSHKILSYIRYSDRKEKEMAIMRRSKPAELKDNIKTAETRDLSMRLYVEEPPDDVRAVNEIHPEFYTVIEGRPLRRFDDIKVYMKNIRNHMMTRQQIGYQRDLIERINKNVAEESEKYNKILLEYKKHVKNFQRYLTEDYKKSVYKAQVAAYIHEKLLKIELEFLDCATETTILNNIIFKLDAIRNNLKMYRKFLIFVAPLPWRRKHDEELLKLDSQQFIEGKYEPNRYEICMDIDKTIEMASLELENPLPNILYHEDPAQMMDLFEAMEGQSGEYLIQLAKSDSLSRRLQSAIKRLKNDTETELEYFKYYIDQLNCEILRKEKLEQFLQGKFYRIINGLFYECVAGEETLKLKLCIEYVYDQVFGQYEEGHANLFEPMRLIELKYEEYRLAMDCIDINSIKGAEKQAFAEDARNMRNAHNAQKELRLFHRMRETLTKAFQPPAKYTRPTFDKLDKSTLKKKHNVKSTSGVSKLTEDDREGLRLFTTWCEGMDPEPFLEEYRQCVIPFLSGEPNPNEPIGKRIESDEDYCNHRYF